MRKLKCILLVIALFCSLFLVTSCKAKEKVFSESGITVTLTNKFKELDNQNFDVCYVSSKIGFAAIGDSKTDLDMGDNQVEEYLSKVLVVNKKTDNVELFEEDDVKFYYSIYEASAEGKTFRYLIVAKEGKDKYYTINFWTLLDDFNKYKDELFKYAKTIVVE